MQKPVKFNWKMERNDQRIDVYIPKDRNAFKDIDAFGDTLKEFGNVTTLNLGHTSSDFHQVVINVSILYDIHHVYDYIVSQMEETFGQRVPKGELDAN